MQKINDNIYVLISLGIAGAFFLAAGVVFFFVAYFKKVARQKAELQKAELAYQASLFTAVIQSQEEERRKIGREMHDEVSSILSGLRLRMTAPSKKMETDEESIAAVNKLSGIVRNISHLLSPPELEMSGFHEAVENLCESFSDNHSIQIVVNDAVPGFITKDKFQLSLSLYRILQELITNTIKHANASVINIHIKNEDGNFIVDYFDNGTGYNYNKEDTAGLGMQNIRSRLLLTGADHSLETAPGKGFHFIIYLSHQHIFNNAEYGQN